MLGYITVDTRLKAILFVLIKEAPSSVSVPECNSSGDEFVEHPRHKLHIKGMRKIRLIERNLEGPSCEDLNCWDQRM